jgi:dihydropyrimidinase
MWLALLFSFGVRSGRLSLNRWVDVCCTQPAQLYGLSHKGHLNPGYDADLVLFDPERKVTLGPEQLHTPLSFSSYEGIRVTGYPVTTISRGEVIVEQGQLMGEPGRGRFVARSYD